VVVVVWPDRKEKKENMNKKKNQKCKISKKRKEKEEMKGEGGQTNEQNSTPHCILLRSHGARRRNVPEKSLP